MLMPKPILDLPLNGHADDLAGGLSGTWSANEAYSPDARKKFSALFAGSNGLYTQDTTDFDLSTLSVFTTITPTTISGDSRTIIHHGNGNANAEWHFRIYINSADNKIAVGIGNGVSEGMYYSNSALVAGVKYRIGITHISDQTSIYINGILDRVQTTKAMSGYTAGQRLNFGARKLTASFDDWFIGTIRDAKIWNVALTPDEVREDFRRAKRAAYLRPQSKPLPQRAPMYSPVGAWGFNGLQDSSGYGNDLTNFGAKLVRNGFKFTGADYLRKAVANYRSTDEQGTIEFWYKSSNLGGYNTVFASADEATTSYFFIVRSRGTGNGLEIVCKNNDTTTDFNGTTNINDGKWHHCSISSDGTNYSAMIDGNTESLSGVGVDGRWFADILNRDNITFGALVYSSVVNYATAEVRGLCVHSTKLADAQIKSIYNRGVPEPSLLELTNGEKDHSVYSRTLTRANVKQWSEWMEFDGASGSVSMNDITDLTGDITIEGEMYLDGLGENLVGRIFDNGKLLLYFPNTGKIAISCNSGVTPAYSESGSLILNKPIHFVITRTSAGITNFIINGVASGTADQSSGTPAAGTTNLFVGNRSADDRTFDGLLRVQVLPGIKTAAWAKSRYLNRRKYW